MLLKCDNKEELRFFTAGDTEVNQALVKLGEAMGFKLAGCVSSVDIKYARYIKFQPKSGFIRTDNSTRSIYEEFSNTCGYHGIDLMNLIAKPIPTLKVNSLSYEIESTDQGFKVGCQSITKEDAKRIAEFFNKEE